MSLRTLTASSLRVLRARPATAFPATRYLSSTRSLLKSSDPYPLPFSSDHASGEAYPDAPTPEHEYAMPRPLDRTGESAESLKARLVYQTRKRGTLETDLLLSTFARDQLDGMSVEELQQFDKLLDEPDWDIFYWAVKKREPPSRWKDTDLLAKLQQHARNEGKVVRMMPALDARPA